MLAAVRLLSTGRPLPADVVKLRFQLLINIARLLTRGGEGLAAYRILDTLGTAFTARTSATVDERTIDLTNPTGTEPEHREVGRWLQATLHTDGLRALTRDGRWTEAAIQARRQHGIGPHLNDGCQIEIITRAAAGDTDGALDVLTRTRTSTPGAGVVADGLRAFCLGAAGRPIGRHRETLAESYLALPRAAQHVVFRVQLALVLIDLGTDTARLVDAAVAITRHTPDAYAAEALLADPQCRTRLTDADRQSLATIVTTAGHGPGGLSQPLLDHLLHSVRLSEKRLTAVLQSAETTLTRTAPTGPGTATRDPAG